MAAAESRRWRHAWIVTAVVAALVVILWDFIAAEWHARDAEREVVTFANSIPLGATRGSVAETFARGNFRHLTRRPHGDERWFFHTPFRMGAKDWIVVLDFERDRVVAVRVATSDNLARRPDGAPPDRVEEIR